MTPRPVPTTAELVEELALMAPLRPAFREEHAELNYGQFYGMVAQCALHLRRLGVRRGERIAVSGPGFGIQLVLLLAAEGIGAATASFQAEDDADAPFLFTQVQWVFSARPQVLPPGVRFQLLDAEFARRLGQPLGAERPVWDPLAAHEPQRIARTSGSSGRSKFMVLSRGAQDHVVVSGIEKATYGGQTRLLVLAPLVVNAAFTRSSACLRRGGMVLGGGAGAQLAQLAPTHVWGLPLQLERFLAEVPAGFACPQPVQVASVGGAMPPVLRQACAGVLRGSIRNRYGSNEVGGISEELDVNGVGVLCAGVDVRILGPDGQDLPAGEPGVIAVRSPALVEGYLERPEETAAAFRDGWFVSGDVGVMVGHRRLRLLGRHDDLVNLGGIKVPAAQLEGGIKARPGIQDCAVQAVHLEGGAVALGVAVVLAPGTTPEQGTEEVRQALAATGDLTIRLLFLPVLPQLQTGKVDRMQLLRLFSGLS